MPASTVLSKLRATSAVLAAFAVIAIPAHATSLVTNGSFESVTTPGFSSEIGSNNGYTSTQNVTGWTSQGYNFLYTSATGPGGNPVAAGQYGNVGLYGGVNGLVASPDGGNFLALDGAIPNQVGPLSQSISGLTPGANYVLSFYYAGAQQTGFDGATTEAFAVTLGNQTINTAVLSDVSHGFTGWQKANLTFTATGATETLSFLAVGTPVGEPPFSLLDGVSLNAATPEPSSLVLLGTGLASIGGMVRMRFKRK